MKIMVTVKFTGGAHIPDGMSPKAQLGTKMPKGLFVPLLSFVAGVLCSSDFGLTLLKGVQRLPTTKESDTADLDSISVAPTLEPDAKVVNWRTPVVV